VKILVTNDDGVFSEGINTLARELKKSAEVTVVAPDRERSAVGHSVTFFNPLRIQKIKEEKNITVYSSDGTPSDCVLLGIYAVMDKKPDVIVSGINRGANMGFDLTYSGTVSAAMEGTIQKIPSIAISLASFEDLYFDYAAKIARKIAKIIYENGLPEGTFLNVNVPNVSEEKIKGVELTKQGKSIYDQKLLKRADPRGIEYYWLTGAYPYGEPIPGTDFAEVHNKKVSITPVHLYMTNENAFEFSLIKHIENNLNKK